MCYVSMFMCLEKFLSLFISDKCVIYVSSEPDAWSDCANTSTSVNIIKKLNISQKIIEDCKFVVSYPFDNEFNAKVRSIFL